MLHKQFFAVVALGVFASLASNAFDVADDPNAQSSIILDHYLQASQLDAQRSAKNAPMQVEIQASVPKWNQQGHMKALRKISAVGKITYRVLGFQGDNTIKSQVIARYLQAEQQGQNDQSITLTPANYKFKLKGNRRDTTGLSVYVFQVTPRKKRVGLYKGELWLDAKSYLPVLEKGIFVKNPSVFFRQVTFEREFAILNGAAVPAHMNSVIDTRMVGKVNLIVDYSSPSVEDLTDDVAEEAAAANPGRN